MACSQDRVIPFLRGRSLTIQLRVVRLTVFIKILFLQLVLQICWKQQIKGFLTFFPVRKKCEDSAHPGVGNGRGLQLMASVSLATTTTTTHNTQHTTHNTQHTTHNTQHTTHNTQHTTHNTQHTTHNTQHTTHNTQHTTHNTQQQQQQGVFPKCAHCFLCVTCCEMDPSWQPVTGAAQRRRGRRLRAAWRHEQQSIAQALATFSHHSSRGQRTARAGEWGSELNYTAKIRRTPTPQAAGTVFYPMDVDDVPVAGVAA